MKKRLIAGLASILIISFSSGLLVTRSLLNIISDFHLLDREEAVAELYTDLTYRIQLVQEALYRHRIGGELDDGGIRDALFEVETDVSLILTSLRGDEMKFASLGEAIEGYTEATRRFLKGGSADIPPVMEQRLIADGRIILERLREVRRKSISDFMKTREDLKERIRFSGYLTVAVFLLASLLLSAVMALMIKGIIGPIEALKRGVDIVASGDLTKRVNIRHGDEIGALADSFNRMADSLMRRDHELKRLNETLEERVRQRTDELNRANELLREHNRRIMEADRVKAEFLANMSHELRTPLNAIIGFSKVMMQGIDGPVNDRQKEDLDIIHKSGSHLLEMINEILDISKIRSGKMGLKMGVFSLGEVISDVVSTQRILAAEKGLSITAEVAPEAETIYADRVRVRQILLNLLSNAVKFTKEGSIRIKAEKKDGEVEISVADTGIGIRQVDIPKVFEEFQQIDNSSTRKYGGTGLGMAITRDLVEMHGGRIWVDSEFKAGSTFYVRLPGRPATGENEACSR